MEDIQFLWFNCENGEVFKAILLYSDYTSWVKKYQCNHRNSGLLLNQFKNRCYEGHSNLARRPGLSLHHLGLSNISNERSKPQNLWRKSLHFWLAFILSMALTKASSYRKATTCPVTIQKKTLNNWGQVKENQKWYNNLISHFPLHLLDWLKMILHQIKMATYCICLAWDCWEKRKYRRGF